MNQGRFYVSVKQQLAILAFIVSALFTDRLNDGGAANGSVMA